MSMTASAARQELKGYIDDIPERSFGVVRNFFSYLAETSPLDEPFLIEPANEEEIAMIEEGVREYERDPSLFKDWKTIKKEQGLA